MYVKFPDKEPVLSFDYHLRSRYGETDKMGYVYYGHYLGYFEVARTEMIRSFGLSYRKMEDEGIMLPVIHSQVEYKGPVYYDEEMTITVKVYETPVVRMQTFYELSVPDRDALCAVGEVTLCFMHEDTRKPLRAPKKFTDKLFS